MHAVCGTGDLVGLRCDPLTTVCFAMLRPALDSRDAIVATGHQVAGWGLPFGSRRAGTTASEVSARAHAKV